MSSSSASLYDYTLVSILTLGRKQSLQSFPLFPAFWYSVGSPRSLTPQAPLLLQRVPSTPITNLSFEPPTPSAAPDLPNSPQHQISSHLQRPTFPRFATDQSYDLPHTQLITTTTNTTTTTTAPLHYVPLLQAHLDLRPRPLRIRHLLPLLRPNSNALHNPNDLANTSYGRALLRVRRRHRVHHSRHSQRSHQNKGQGEADCLRRPVQRFQLLTDSLAQMPRTSDRELGRSLVRRSFDDE